MNNPIICAECDHAAIKGHYLYCEKKKRTIYNSKPNWCPLEKEEQLEDEQLSFNWEET